MTDEVIQTLDEVEKDQIIRALHHYKWVKKHTASVLGIARSTLLYKMRKYNISQD